MNNNERRLKIVYVPEHEIFDYFVMGLRLRRGDGRTQVIDMPTLPLDVAPAGAKLVEVRHDWEWRAFAFVISHESFPEVPFGEKIPVATTETEVTDEIQQVVRRDCVPLTEFYFPEPDAAEQRRRNELRKMMGTLTRTISTPMTDSPDGVAVSTLPPDDGWAVANVYHGTSPLHLTRDADGRITWVEPQPRTGQERLPSLADMNLVPIEGSEILLDIDSGRLMKDGQFVKLHPEEANVAWDTMFKKHKASDIPQTAPEASNCICSMKDLLSFGHRPECQERRKIE